MGLTNNLGKLSNMITSTGSAVGIGTTSPTTLLQLSTARTNGTNVNVLTISDTTSGTQTVGFGTRIQYLSNGTAVQAAIGLEQGGTGTNNESQIGFYTQNTAGALTRQVTISSTGNVGIGNASPDALLRIDSNVASTSNNMLYLYNSDYTATTRTFIRVRNNITSGSSYSSYFGQGVDHKTYIIANDTSRNDIVINGDNGYVGIGTNDPQSKFDVTNVVSTAYDGSNTLTSGQSMRIANTSTTSGVAANLLFIATGAGGGNGIGTISGVNTGTGSLSLAFATRDSGGSVAERMRITNYPSSATLGNGGVMKLLGTGTNSAYTELQFYTYNGPTNQPPVSIGIIKTDNGGYENGEFYIATKATNANTAPIERLRVLSGGNLRFSNVPADYWQLDSYQSISIATGGNIVLSSFSGVVIVNNWTNGQCAIWVCGGGVTSLFASANSGSTGTMAYNGTYNGYQFTANYGATASYGVFAIRTRPGA